MAEQPSRPDPGPGRLRIPVHYDFASTLCYVAHRVIGRMQDFFEELALDLAWTPVDLARLMGWRRGASIDPNRMENVRQIADAFEVPVRLPTRWLDSRRAGAIALHLDGEPQREASWRERVFSAIYEEGRSPESDDTLAQLARDLGLAPSAADIAAGLQDLETRTTRAQEAQVSGVPTFMLGDWPFGGIQDEATLRAVLGRWASRQRLPR